MIRPDLTDPELRKEIEEYRKEAAERGGFYDPDLDAILTQQEQEPGFWEEMADLSEKIWPSKKPEAEDTPSNGANPDETPPAG
ncbi:MAG: hypothetical protein EOP84_26550 [Verrucomicrobiaceae bacterium]|nr:MAG: hypothetical protein EOP84_26550 [Verrucomicrobiaceae bacterium]